jgi:2-oxoglutarate/2-oxoacid ferredoxin oxidoreductase subunit alpha
MSAGRVLMEGSHAIAEAAIQAGCRFYAGYPITPSTEILEYMSFRQPQVGGVCVNAESEIEAINMVWGAAGCGVRAMIASTGQGISLMQEALAEMPNAEIPCVVVNMMRGQGDYYQATRGGGHGDYRHLVLAPHTVQEAVDLIGLAFYLGDKWRTPVDVLGDFVLGHTSEAVEFQPRDESDLAPKTWAATGATGRRAHNVTPLGSPEKLNLRHGEHFTLMAAKYPRIAVAETRCETGLLDDAEIAVVAFGSPARFVKYAVRQCRAQGLRVGWIRPITLWPFPDGVVADVASRVRTVAVFEQNAGQMIDDVRLAVLGHAPVVAIGGISHDHSGFGVGPLLEPANIIRRITDVYRGKAAA